MYYFNRNSVQQIQCNISDNKVGSQNSCAYVNAYLKETVLENLLCLYSSITINFLHLDKGQKRSKS